MRNECPAMRVTSSRLMLAGHGATVALVVGLLGCQPTVRVEAPKEPITINLNIRLDADVRLRVEEQAKEDVATNPIF